MKRAAKIVTLIFVLALALALFSGCGNSQQQTQQPQQSQETQKPAENSPVETPPPDSSGIIVAGEHDTDETTKYADEIVLGYANVASGWNPMRPVSMGGTKSIAMRMVYNTLLARVPVDGKCAYGPMLATEWSSDENCENWTFKLRDDVYFHNGEKFTADDVKFTVEILQTIPGAQGATKVNMIKSVEVVNDYEVIMHLNGPCIDFEDNMANHNTSIMCRSAVEANEDEGTKIGTGPWKLDEFNPNTYITFVRNDDYWGEPALAKKFTIKAVAEPTALAIMFENGEVDFIVNFPFQNYAAYQANPDIEVDSFFSIGTQYLGFNMNSQIAGDINFRKAVVYAINREDFNDITMQGYGYVWDSQAYWGLGTGYKKDIPVIEQDLEKAKEYLAKSSYVPGTPVLLITSGDMANSNAQVFQQQMSEIGVTIELFETDNATLMANCAWGSTAYDLISFASQWDWLPGSCSFSIHSGTSGNKAQWSNPRVDELIDLGSKTPNGPERQAIYYEIQDLEAEEIPYIGLLNINMFMGRRANCGGVIYWQDSYFDFSHAYKILEE